MTLQPVHRHLGHQILGLLDDPEAVAGRTYRTPSGAVATVLLGDGDATRALPRLAFLGGLVWAAMLAFPYRPGAPLDLLSGYWWRWRAYPRAYGLTRADLDRLTRDYGGPATEVLQRDLTRTARAAEAIRGGLDELSATLGPLPFTLDGQATREALPGLLEGTLPTLPPDPNGVPADHPPPYLNLKPAVRAFTHAA